MVSHGWPNTSVRWQDRPPGSRTTLVSQGALPSRGPSAKSEESASGIFSTPFMRLVVNPQSQMSPAVRSCSRTFPS